MLDFKADKTEIIERRGSSGSQVHPVEMDKLYNLLKSSSADQEENSRRLEQLIYKGKQEVQDLAQSLTQIL